MASAETIARAKQLKTEGASNSYIMDILKLSYPELRDIFYKN